MEQFSNDIISDFSSLKSSVWNDLRLWIINQKTEIPRWIPALLRTIPGSNQFNMPDKKTLSFLPQLHLAKLQTKAIRRLMKTHQE